MFTFTSNFHDQSQLFQPGSRVNFRPPLYAFPFHPPLFLHSKSLLISTHYFTPALFLKLLLQHILYSGITIKRTDIYQIVLLLRFYINHYKQQRPPISFSCNFVKDFPLLRQLQGLMFPKLWLVRLQSTATFNYSFVI